jgi:hypothetical protein
MEGAFVAYTIESVMGFDTDITLHCECREITMVILATIEHE